jgi:hypothetical protein
MTWLREHWKVIAVSTSHALLLAILTLVWMNLSWQFGDEVIVARINQIARYQIFNPTNNVVERFKQDLLLVNTSYDNELVTFDTDEGTGNIAIADRKKLAEFLHIMNDSDGSPTLVVMDVVFKYTSDNDSLLRGELRKIKNLVISSEVDRKTGRPSMPWPELNFALAQYETTTGTFLKYNLVSDTIQYLPAAMYHETQGIKLHQEAGLVKSDDDWWMNSFIVDLPVRAAHISNGVVCWNLGDVMRDFTAEDIQENTKNRVIIIGDFFDHDIHQTLLGEQPGPLIVANAYLGMLQGIPRIKFLDGFLIFALYFFSSMYALTWRQHKDKISGRMKVGKFALKYLTYILIFSLYSIFLYLLTSRHFQLLIFGLYFNLFEYLVDRYKLNVE